MRGFARAIASLRLHPTTSSRRTRNLDGVRDETNLPINVDPLARNLKQCPQNVHGWPGSSTIARRSDGLRAADQGLGAVPGRARTQWTSRACGPFAGTHLCDLVAIRRSAPACRWTPCRPKRRRTRKRRTSRIRSMPRGPLGDAAHAEGDRGPAPPRRRATMGRSAPQIVRTALCVECATAGSTYSRRRSRPPGRLRGTHGPDRGAAAKCDLRGVIEGYLPAADPRLQQTVGVTPDPGVIEVNVHPAGTWGEL